MAIQLKVQWVDRFGDADAIQNINAIGGSCRNLQWRHTSAQAVESIENGWFDYYVKKGASALRLQLGRTPDGKKFLTVEKEAKDFLLSLPTFPDSSRPGASRPA
ncbi:MAG TPA: hypothetical protein VFV81_09435 [Verrucomicrobiae bacterium]|nr:hypothetical protein [Verrucomicrobiae bacterium]